MSFLDFSVADLKCVLTSLAANKCYNIACSMPRKDITTAVGFWDLHITLCAKKKLAGVPNDGFSFLFHWESAITGCTLTADRLAAAGLVDQSNCRFCGAPKESLEHFVDECSSLPHDLRQPGSSFFLGPSFRMLGVAEIPLDAVRAKLTVSSTAELRVCPWTSPLEPVMHLWTDGSVQLTQYPWLALASYAAVTSDETLASVGTVRRWRLSSYSAELYMGDSSGVC